MRSNFRHDSHIRPLTTFEFCYISHMIKDDKRKKNKLKSSFCLNKNSKHWDYGVNYVRILKEFRENWQAVIFSCLQETSSIIVIINNSLLLNLKTCTNILYK